MLFRTVACSVTTGISFMVATMASAQSLDSHEHGASELNVARLGNVLQVEFISPAFNLLGFERAPATEQERAQVAALTTQLDSSAWLFGDALAACTMEVVMLETPAYSDHEVEDMHHDAHEDESHEAHGHEEGLDAHHDDQAGSHADVHIEYRFDCPTALPANLEILAFEQFPGIEEITVQWITEQNQGMAELTASNTLLRLR